MSPLASSPLSSFFVTGHNIVSCGKEGKKNFTIGFPCLASFAKVQGKKATPSGLYCLPEISRLDRSANLEGHVNVNNISDFPCYLLF